MDLKNNRCYSWHLWVQRLLFFRKIFFSISPIRFFLRTHFLSEKNYICKKCLTH